MAMTAVSALGGLVGAFGKGKNKGQQQQSKSGFESLPQAQQDYMLDNIFPRIQEESERPFVGIQKRQLDSSDTDPIFGSQRRVAYDQSVKDKIRGELMYGGGQGGPQAAPSAAPDLASMFVSGLQSTASRTQPRGELLSRGMWANDIASSLEGGNYEAMNTVLDKWGITPSNMRTQNIQAMLPELMAAARS